MGEKENGDRIRGRHRRGSGSWSGLSLSIELSRFRKCGDGREKNVKEALKV